MRSDLYAIENQMARIRQILITYSDRDTQNADEFGLYYRQLPGWTLSKKPYWDSEMVSVIMLLACTNAEG